jgi:7-cyano-7-deazaguanine synthase
MRQHTSNKRAIVLLSGGLDSATTLYLAKSKGYKVSCLIFDYGQRHKRELNSARALARKTGCDFKVIRLAFPSKGSSLLNRRAPLPPARLCNKNRKNIPSTYVPARNLIFLSMAVSFAESIKAGTIFIGANAIDYSGYPDCRPQFYREFRKVITVGTKAGCEGKDIRVATPLIKKSKKEIIRLGTKLGVPYELTWSCYRGARRPCGVCESCFLRAKGFEEARLKDPLL